ncbi:hypothetical protein Pst134EA_002746 [Puccinia striiformis f. sp. tritici]|uniref:hypothetical protein n=1 Tax=Puccinia striiformis f. sp. tritici TaxID=168172 RepID=UPI0020082C9E|nr:hypothetical protein Pst134EA_002746 [Puccinia striiformis f. sp. tritici]KAH9472120.1 hypothetical protein Pst134EA_002746 [Puccinia striiformis f. sp. tritici]
MYIGAGRSCPLSPSSIILPFRPSITTYRHRTQDGSIPFEWDPFLPRPLRRLVLLRLFGSGFLIPVSAFLRLCNRSSGAFELDRPLLQVSFLIFLIYLLAAVVIRGPGSSDFELDHPSSTLLIHCRPRRYAPPFHSVPVSCLVSSSISAWVLRRCGWQLGSSVIFGVLLMGLAILEATLIDSQLWSSKGAPLLRFTPPSSFLINSSLPTNTPGSLTSNLTTMPQQTHPSPYQPNHSYGLRPQVAPIRSYGGPVPRPSPVHPAANVPARRSGFVQRPLTPMPVTRNGPCLSNPARQNGSNQRAVASTPVIRNVPFLSDTISNSFRFGGRPGPVLTANIRDPRLLMGNQTALRANSANPYLFPPPSPIFDRTLRSPTPFPPSLVWAEFFRNTASSQGS